MSDKVSPDQIRDELFDHFRLIARYWADLPDMDKETGKPLTVQDRCEGVVFSVLGALDGCSSLPAFDLVARNHPDDEDQRYEGVTISGRLHEHYYQKGGGNE